VQYARTALINHACNVRLVKLLRVMAVQFHGDPVIMHIILIVSTNGQAKRRLSALYAKVSGIL